MGHLGFVTRLFVRRQWPILSVWYATVSCMDDVVGQLHSDLVVVIRRDAFRAEVRWSEKEYDATTSPESLGGMTALHWLAGVSSKAPTTFKPEVPTRELAAEQLRLADQSAGVTRDDDDFHWYLIGVRAALAWAIGRSTVRPGAYVAVEFAAAMARSSDLPVWATPGPFEVRWSREALRRRMAGPDRRSTDAGSVAALDWACRGSVDGAPITGNRQPPSAPAARVELFAAIEALGDPAPQSVYDELQAARRRPRENLDHDYMVGVAFALGWMTGASETPPIAVDGRG